MALSQVNSLKGLQRRLQGWPAAEICDASDPRSVDAQWRTVRGPSEFPVGIQVYVRGVGESAARFRAKLPIVEPPAALTVAEATTEDASARLSRQLDEMAVALSRLGQLQLGTLQLVERAADAGASIPDLRQRIAVAEAKSSQDLAQVEVIRQVRQYADLLLGGLAVKAGVLTVDQWTVGKDMLALYAACLEAGLTPQEGVTVLRSMAGADEGPTDDGGG